VTTAAQHSESEPIPFSPAEIGMIAFLVSEVAFFSTLIVAYLTFLGKDTVGPTPVEALSLPIALVTSAFLLSSSVSIHLAEKSLHAGHFSLFRGWWALTIALGATFLIGTLYEWSELMREHQLTISRNLFGTTYYTLIGFHALHVTCGLIAMLIVLRYARVRDPQRVPHQGVKLVGWYWHFVDAVWIVVFMVVYVWGR
jgi:cytochrome c oxidase subunit III